MCVCMRQDTRITRGDGGSVFVLVKDVSFSAPLPPTTTAIVPIEDSPAYSSVPATIPTPAISTPAPYLSVSPLLSMCARIRVHTIAAVRLCKLNYRWSFMAP